MTTMKDKHSKPDPQGLDAFRQFAEVREYFAGAPGKGYAAILIHMDPELEEYRTRIYKLWNGAGLQPTDLPLIAKMHSAVQRLKAA